MLAAAPSLTPVKDGPECTGGTSLTVVSFNAKFARADPDELSALIHSVDADIVVLLETDEALIEALLDREELATDLPHRTREVSPGAVSGSVILSAFPLRDEEDIPGSVFDQVSAVAVLPGGEAGDLNASFAHPVFRTLAAPFRSAAEATGPIPGPTWPQDKPVPPFTAIDHILARNAAPTHEDIVRIDGSDHAAIVGGWALCPR